MLIAGNAKELRQCLEIDDLSISLFITLNRSDFYFEFDDKFGY
jgi:hypothetical protein